MNESGESPCPHCGAWLMGEGCPRCGFGDLALERQLREKPPATIQIGPLGEGSSARRRKDSTRPGGRSRRLAGWLAAVVIVLLIGWMASGVLRSTRSEAQPPDTTTTTTTASPEAQALAELERLYADDRRKDVIRGQWVAQVASGQVGERGATAVALLNAHRGLADSPAFGSKVRLIQQGDWGRTTASDPPMWVSVVDLGARSEPQVLQWCDAQKLTDGGALALGCLPRQLKLKE